MIVVDTNIIVYLYLEGERSAQVEKLLEKDMQWVAPLLWRSEFRNVLALYMRKRNLSLELAQQIMREAMLLMQGREYEIVSSHVLERVAASGCSAYDCEFVALAEDLGTSLVTVDKKILKEFSQIAVSLDDILAS
jgi:predicted nucleic acid-binding protein